MKKLDEISINAKKLYEDLKDLEQSSKKEKLNDIDFNYFRGVAKHNAFNEHILKNENEYIQKNYLYLISSLLMFNNKEEVKNSQFLYIARLVAGFSNKNLDIENIYANAMIMDGKQLSDCIEVIKNYKDVFVVDSLICANIEGKANDEVLEYLSEIYFMMGVKYNEFNKLLNLCNAILENSSEKICEIEIRTIGRYRHHINKMFKEKVFYNLEEISKDEKGNILLLNYNLDMKGKILKSDLEIFCADTTLSFSQCIYGDSKINFVDNNHKFNTDMSYMFKIESLEYLDLKEGYINLNNYSFDRMKLINCKFNGIVGIKSTNKNLEFINCVIENIKKNYIYSEGEYITSKIIEPVNLRNSIFKNCVIKNCQIDDNDREIMENYILMKFDRCTFENTKFIDCVLLACNFERSSVLYLYDSKIKKCLFIENKSTFKTNIIDMINSSIEESIFKVCKLLDSVSEASIIISENSKIYNNVFEECYGQYENYRKDKQVIGHILTLDYKSKERDNKFEKCDFYTFIENK